MMLRYSIVISAAILIGVGLAVVEKKCKDGSAFLLCLALLFVVILLPTLIAIFDDGTPVIGTRELEEALIAFLSALSYFLARRVGKTNKK